MSDRIKKIKIKQADGTFSDYIPIGANAKDIDLQYNGSNVENTLKKKPYYYDSVAEMKLDDTLKEGDMAITLGYYEANDGGGAEYEIGNFSEEDALSYEGGMIHTLASNLKAKIIIYGGKINVDQFGAKGDGITDDTEAIQKAINSASTIFFSSKTYMINAETSLYPQNSSHIILNNNTILKVIPNSNSNYEIFDIKGKDNVIIEGGILEGDKDTHLGSDGQWGMGISINGNSENILIKNMIMRYFWGDGLYINKAKNVKTQNNIFESNRRQGISIISVNKYYSLNDSAFNTQGSDPEDGIDIEPNNDNDELRSIVIENFYSENNHGAGIQIFAMNKTNPDYPIEITIINHTDVSSSHALSIAKPPTSKGYIKVIDSVYIKTLGGSINCSHSYDSDCRIDIIRPQVIECNQNGKSGTAYNTAFGMWVADDEYSSYPLGNVYIYEPKFIQNKEGEDGSPLTTPCIYITNTTSSDAGIRNVGLINPILLSPSYSFFLSANAENCFIQDDYKIFQFNHDYNANILASNTPWTYISDENFTQSRSIEIKSQLIGSTTRFEKVNANYTLSVKLPDTCNLIGYKNDFNTLGATISCNIAGTVWELKKVNNTCYMIVCSNMDSLSIT